MDPWLFSLSHPLALVAAILLFGGCLAALAPFTGLKQFWRNLAIAVVVLVVLMFVGATVGAVVGFSA